MPLDVHPMLGKKCPHCGATEGLMAVDAQIFPESDEPMIDLTQTLFTKYKWFVLCDKCGAQGPQADDKFEAVELWNKREGCK